MASASKQKEQLQESKKKISERLSEVAGKKKEVEEKKKEAKSKREQLKKARRELPEFGSARELRGEGQFSGMKGRIQRKKVKKSEEEIKKRKGKIGDYISEISGFKKEKLEPTEKKLKKQKGKVESGLKDIKAYETAKELYFEDKGSIALGMGGKVWDYYRERAKSERQAEDAAEKRIDELDKKLSKKENLEEYEKSYNKLKDWEKKNFYSPKELEEKGMVQTTKKIEEPDINLTIGDRTDTKKTQSRLDKAWKNMSGTGFIPSVSAASKQKSSVKEKTLEKEKADGVTKKGTVTKAPDLNLFQKAWSKVQQTPAAQYIKRKTGTSQDVREKAESVAKGTGEQVQKIIDFAKPDTYGTRDGEIDVKNFESGTGVNLSKDTEQQLKREGGIRSAEESYVPELDSYISPSRTGTGATGRIRPPTASEREQLRQQEIKAAAITGVPAQMAGGIFSQPVTSKEVESLTGLSYLSPKRQYGVFKNVEEYERAQREAQPIGKKLEELNKKFDKGEISRSEYERKFNALSKNKAYKKVLEEQEKRGTSFQRLEEADISSVKKRGGQALAGAGSFAQFASAPLTTVTGLEETRKGTEELEREETKKQKTEAGIRTGIGASLTVGGAFGKPIAKGVSSLRGGRGALQRVSAAETKMGLSGGVGQRLTKFAGTRGGRVASAVGKEAPELGISGLYGYDVGKQTDSVGAGLAAAGGAYFGGLKVPQAARKVREGEKLSQQEVQGLEKEFKGLESRKFKDMTIEYKGAGNRKGASKVDVYAVRESPNQRFSQKVKVSGDLVKTKEGTFLYPEAKGTSVVKGDVSTKGYSDKTYNKQSNFQVDTVGKSINLGETGGVTASTSFGFSGVTPTKSFNKITRKAKTPSGEIIQDIKTRLQKPRVEEGGQTTTRVETPTSSVLFSKRGEGELSKFGITTSGERVGGYFQFEPKKTTSYGFRGGGKKTPFSRYFKKGEKPKEPQSTKTSDTELKFDYITKKPETPKGESKPRMTDGEGLTELQLSRYQAKTQPDLFSVQERALREGIGIRPPKGIETTGETRTLSYLRAGTREEIKEPSLIKEQKLDVETKEPEVQKQRQEIITGLGTRTKTQAQTDLDIGTAPKTKTRSAIDTLGQLKQSILGKTEIDTGVKSQARTGLRQAARTKTQAQTAQKTKTRPLTKTATPKPKPTPFPFGLPEGKRKKAEEETEDKDFEAFVFKGGEPKKIGEFGRKKKAREALFGEIGTTLRASGFVTREGEPVKLDLGSGFRRSKQDPFRVVEKKEKRIKKGTPETFEIQALRPTKGKKTSLI